MTYLEQILNIYKTSIEENIEAKLKKDLNYFKENCIDKIRLDRETKAELKDAFLCFKSKYLKRRKALFSKEDQSKFDLLLKHKNFWFKFKKYNDTVIKKYIKDAVHIEKYNQYLSELKKLKATTIKIYEPKRIELLPADISKKHLDMMKRLIQEKRKNQIIEVKSYKKAPSLSANVKLKNKNTVTIYEHETFQERLNSINIATTDIYLEPYFFELHSDKTIISAEEYLNMRIHRKKYHRKSEFYFNQIILNNKKVILDKEFCSIEDCYELQLQGFRILETRALEYSVYHRQLFNSEKDCIEYFKYDAKNMPKAKFTFNKNVNLIKNLIAFSDALNKTGQNEHTRDSIMRYIISSKVINNNTFSQFCSLKI